MHFFRNIRQDFLMNLTKPRLESLADGSALLGKRYNDAPAIPGIEISPQKAFLFKPIKYACEAAATQSDPVDEFFYVEHFIALEHSQSAKL